MYRSRYYYHYYYYPIYIAPFAIRFRGAYQFEQLCTMNEYAIHSTCTRSSTTVTLKRPTVSSRLKITDRSFTHHASVLIGISFQKNFANLPFILLTLVNLGLLPLLDLSTSQFQSKLKTHLFHKSFPT